MAPNPPARVREGRADTPSSVSSPTRAMTDPRSDRPAGAAWAAVGRIDHAAAAAPAS